MKLFFAILVLAISAAVAGEKPDSDAFTAAFKKAIIEHDEKTLLSFADSETMGESLKKLFEDPDVYSVSLAPLPPDFSPFFIKDGKRYEPTHPPAGMVTISIRRNGGLTSNRLVYAIVDGAYKIVSTKIVDLHWEGPPDASLGYSVEGIGADKIEVKAEFNASGVDVEQKFLEAYGAFWGQYISSVEVKTDNPEAMLVLKIIHDGKVIYESEPLKGSGTITYTKEKPRAELSR